MTSTQDAPSTAADIRNPFFARFYHHVLGRGESPRFVDLRRELLEGLTGRVIEIGPGNGPNFGLYPAAVGEVIAVEPEPYLRRRATEAAAKAPVQIAVVSGDAEHLPVADASVDAVVFALVLCSVPDPTRALSEATRVLRPGGQLRVLEHVVAEQPFGRRAQRIAEVTFWRRAFGNCHPTRDSRSALVQAGFDVSGVRRFVMRAAPIEPPLPYILGTAVLNP